MPTNGYPPALGRRNFLFGASAAIGGLAVAQAEALSIFRREPEPAAEASRSLYMVQQRTGEIFHEVYFDGRRYFRESLERFAHFARDLSTGNVGEMDPHLLDLAAELQGLVGPDEPLILTHGFRARRVRRGAANSFHLEGRALDVTHPRLRASELHQHAATLGRGGLGRYARFVHIDTGPTRRW